MLHRLGNLMMDAVTSTFSLAICGAGVLMFLFLDHVCEAQHCEVSSHGYSLTW